MREGEFQISNSIVQRSGGSGTWAPAIGTDLGAYEFVGSMSMGDVPGNQPAVALRQYLRAAPNPFNPSTSVYFGVERAGIVAVSIYALAGRRVRTLTLGAIAAGEHEVQWQGQDSNGRAVASGVYICR